jgi:hypothetical protein
VGDSSFELEDGGALSVEFVGLAQQIVGLYFNEEIQRVTLLWQKPYTLSPYCSFTSCTNSTILSIWTGIWLLISTTMPKARACEKLTF